MTRVEIVCITMVGAEYALFDRGEGPEFPRGELRDGEPVADGARRLVAEWAGATLPKLEVVDFLSSPGGLAIVMRALVAEAPRPHRRAPRMGLPPKVGPIDGKWIEEALKTSVAYKLTRG